MTQQINVFAHRGFSGQYPENTRLAFEQALALGVEGIEFDLRLSRDDELVVIHDAAVDRNTDGSGQVRELTWSELAKLDAGSWKSPAFTGERLLTFADALGYLVGRARLNIHLKAEEDNRTILVEKVLRTLAEYDGFASAYLASDQDTLTLARSICPDVTMCNLSRKPLEGYLNRTVAIGATITQPSNKVVTPQLVQAAHERDLEVTPYYADEIPEMQRLIDCGVDGMLTNQPLRLLELRTQL